jgi:hypothetical protein
MKRRPSNRGANRSPRRPPLWLLSLDADEDPCGEKQARTVPISQPCFYFPPIFTSNVNRGGIVIPPILYIAPYKTGEAGGGPRNPRSVGDAPQGPRRRGAAGRAPARRTCRRSRQGPATEQRRRSRRRGARRPTPPPRSPRKPRRLPAPTSSLLPLAAVGGGWQTPRRVVGGWSTPASRRRSRCEHAGSACLLATGTGCEGLEERRRGVAYI